MQGTKSVTVILPDFKFLLKIAIILILELGRTFPYNQIEICFFILVKEYLGKNVIVSDFLFHICLNFDRNLKVNIFKTIS